jgi:hypothetical protein
MATLENLQDKTRLLLGGISATEYSAVNLNVAINSYYDDFIIQAILANKDWEVNGEVATANLVANQREYILPSDLLTIKKIEVNAMTGAAENQWTSPRIVDLRSMPSVALTNYQDSDDTRESFFEIRLYDESLIFNWLPKNSVTNGLKIYYSKEATAMTEGNKATDIPNLPNTLQIGLAYGAVLDYALQTEQNKRISNFKALLEEKLEETTSYYKQRITANREGLRTRVENYE